MAVVSGGFPLVPKLSYLGTRLSAKLSFATSKPDSPSPIRVRPTPRETLFQPLKLASFQKFRSTDLDYIYRGGSLVCRSRRSKTDPSHPSDQSEANIPSENSIVKTTKSPKIGKGTEIERKFPAFERTLPVHFRSLRDLFSRVESRKSSAANGDGPFFPQSGASARRKRIST